MFENEYLPHVLIRAYLETHPSLSDAARQLLHENVLENPYDKRWYFSSELEAYGLYAQTQKYLVENLAVLNEETANEEEYVLKRDTLFDQSTQALVHATQLNEQCVLARLLLILLNGIDVDECIQEMMKLSQEAQGLLEQVYPALLDTPSPDLDVSSDPLLIGYLQTNEALVMHCIASARYRKALEFIDIVLKFPQYTSRMGEIKLLCLARLEDETGFNQAAEKLEEHYDGVLEHSAWYKLSRTLLLYKKGKTRAAQRAAKDFAQAIDGGAFFTIMPVFHMPYLPVHPPARTSWELAHQAAFDADGLINDTPDFALWFAQIDQVAQIAESFAQKNGFDFGPPQGFGPNSNPAQ